MLDIGPVLSFASLWTSTSSQSIKELGKYQAISFFKKYRAFLIQETVNALLLVF